MNYVSKRIIKISVPNNAFEIKEHEFERDIFLIQRYIWFEYGDDIYDYFDFTPQIADLDQTKGSFNYYTIVSFYGGEGHIKYSFVKFKTPLTKSSFDKMIDFVDKGLEILKTEGKI